ncbi:hypothetical protein [Streptomyces aculeolatus]
MPEAYDKDAGWSQPLEWMAGSTSPAMPVTVAPRADTVAYLLGASGGYLELPQCGPVSCIDGKVVGAGGDGPVVSMASGGFGVPGSWFNEDFAPAGVWKDPTPEALPPDTDVPSRPLRDTALFVPLIGGGDTAVQVLHHR